MNKTMLLLLKTLRWLKGYQAIIKNQKGNGKELDDLIIEVEKHINHGE